MKVRILVVASVSWNQKVPSALAGRSDESGLSKPSLHERTMIKRSLLGADRIQPHKVREVDGIAISPSQNLLEYFRRPFGPNVYGRLYESF